MNYSVFIPCESAYQLKVVFDSTRLEKRVHCFSVVLFSVQYKVVLTYESLVETLKCNIKMKDIEQYFPVMFIVLYKVVLSFKSVKKS